MNERERLIEASRIDLKNGTYTINEIRKRLGETERPEPEANKLLVLTTGRGWVTFGDKQPVRINVAELLPRAFDGDVG
jgi:hypothetical protein